MRILVTGGAGFVGTNLIKRLLEDKHHILSIDNYSTGLYENEQIGCIYYDLDLSKEKNLEKELPVSCCKPGYSIELLKLWDFDMIYHLAALARIQPSLTSPRETIYNNFISTLNILEYARKNKIKVIYAGSSSIHHGLYKSPYAWSKFSGEHLCKLYSNVYDMDTVICRFYNVYGPYQIEIGEYSTVIGIFKRQYKEKDSLTVVGDGEQRRDFTHIDDIVDGLIKCSEQSFKGEIFELGRGINYSINEVADMFGKNYPKKYIKVRLGEYDRTLADYSFAQDILKWKPKKDLKQYIISITK